LNAAPNASAPASIPLEVPMNRHALTVSAVLLLAAGAEAQPVAWNLDAAHSHVGFTARHLGFAKVRGEFGSVSAKITADAKTGKITALEATAEAKSVDTGVQKRDDDLRSDHFFNAEQYPTLKLVLKSIKWSGKKFTAVVALTIRDVTKDVTFKGELLGVQTVNFGRGAHQRAGYEASATINRKDFGLKFAGVAEGIAIVGDEVELQLEVEMTTTP
jgi:polyisoprenoid-binding protein YceI